MAPQTRNRRASARTMKRLLSAKSMRRRIRWLAFLGGDSLATIAPRCFGERGRWRRPDRRVSRPRLFPAHCWGAFLQRRRRRARIYFRPRAYRPNRDRAGGGLPKLG